MAVESALSVVVLSACFSLIFWNALIHRKLTRLRRSYYTAWFYFPDMPYVSAALQTAWLAASGYLLWSGSEPYAPAELLDSFNGQMYTAAFTLFFLFIGVESLLNQHLERLNATNELKFFTFVVRAGVWFCLRVCDVVRRTLRCGSSCLSSVSLMGQYGVQPGQPRVSLVSISHERRGADLCV